MDLSIEIRQAREEIYDACEQSHLLMEDSNPTFSKDNILAAESY